MQINLKAHSITQLTFTSNILLTSDLVDQIHIFSKPDEEGDSVFFDKYENHIAWVWIYKAEEETLKSKIEFFYEARKSRKLRKSAPRISQLIDIFSTFSQQPTFECQASFTFPKKSRAKSIIHLPQIYMELPDRPFDRIQGMHLVKLDGSETKYDVFLEVPTRGVIIENIIFKCTFKIDNNLANNVLSEALNISEKLIFKE